MKKTLLIVSVVFSGFLLVGCGQAEKIKSGKIASVKATVISTSPDKDGWFTLIPMTTVIGKNTVINMMPIYQETDSVRINYKYQGREKSVNTEDFEVVKHNGSPYIRIRKSDIGKNDIPIVLYTHD
ncbi:hypothetical protein [Lacticaseibacillus paracasei]|uniref:hypothetical protein n=1 Tax=Lacticaseibacillus paracasei TaxID=1597 RepID=UPI00192AB50F|nr:hypothetical protein [Lacticaseibacillus paracasei]CAD7483797.1 Prophage protein [Lacticaseibacillus paracasei]